MKRTPLSCLLAIVLLLLSCENEDKPVSDDPALIVEKRATPVLARSDGLYSDPSVIRIGDTLFMWLSDYALATDVITFSPFKSADGLNWQPVRLDAFAGSATGWDKLIETPEVIRIGDQLHLYYIGYPESDFDDGIYDAEVGLATAAIGESFTRYQPAPVLPRGGTWDEDAITSPGVVAHEGKYYMIYTGWTDILEATGFLGLTGAVSDDGVNWTKTEEAIFSAVSQTPFETATESDITKGPDGMFFLFFSAENGIALARSSAPFGPWEIYPEPIIRSKYEWESGEVVAPAALIENGKARIWYTGVVGDFVGGSVGYAEIDFPFAW